MFLRNKVNKKPVRIPPVLQVSSWSLSLLLKSWMAWMFLRHLLLVVGVKRVEISLGMFPASFKMIG